MSGCVKLCTCDVSMGNTGYDCMPAMQVAKKLIMVAVVDSDGNRNFIDLTATLNSAYFTAKINNADASKRWFPLPELKDINDGRDNPIVETFKDNSSIFIADSPRKFEGLIVGRNGSPVLASKIEAARCNEVGVFIVDRMGNLIGAVDEDDTKLYPIRLDTDSLNAMFIHPTDTTSQKLKLAFSFHADESDKCLRMLQRSEMTNVDLLVLKGLLDVHAEFDDLLATGCTVKLTTDYGTAKTKTVVTGLVTADFVSSSTATTGKVRNITGGADVTVTVTESTTEKGLYTLVWASQTTGNKILVAIKKNGFDFTEVPQTELTMP